MEIREYALGESKALYLLSEEGRVSLLLLPADAEAPVAKNWELGPGRWDTRSEYIREWRPGSLVQLQLAHHARSRGNGVTMKFSESTAQLKFEKQWQEDTDQSIQIWTELSADEGYRIRHRLVWEKDVRAFWCETTFVNDSDRTFTLEMLTSFCLENLSPYQLDNDQTDKLALHRFYGGWALEGRHVSVPIEDLGLQKAWGSAFIKGERFGSVGSWTTQRYFPTAAVEDKEHHILWAASLETVSSWQMELTRDGDTLSFSGGIADAETGAWSKHIAPGEQFTAPRARLCAAAGDIQDVCQKLLDLQKKAYLRYGEKGLPITFNEYCSSWGNPTQEKELQYARILRDKGIGYFVIDAGWSEGSREQWGNGEWILDKERFPDLKAFSREIRQMGMVPGIWFEFEVTTDGSKVFAPDYDDRHLKRNGEVIRFGTDRSFWDFRNPETIAYLQEKLIDFLKTYELGYLKVDYNGNIGIGCDGAESLGEGLRQQMEAVKAFFVHMKEEIPELIIENCASGGHRLESSMMSVTALSSFSDAHEAREIPCIAGNVQSLCIPAQNSIWAVLRSQDSIERIEYSIAAGFLGRLCLSGDIESLSCEQWEAVQKGIALYQKAENILLNGTTRIHRSKAFYTRHPVGLQVAERRNEQELLIIAHGFEDAGDILEIFLDRPYKVVESYGHIQYNKKDGVLQIGVKGDLQGGVLYLKV